jgi:hypothetical protein
VFLQGNPSEKFSFQRIERKAGINTMKIKLTKKSLGWIGALLAAVLLTLTFPQQAAADDNDPPGRVARIRYLQGSVSFQPAGETDWAAAVINRPMTTGDRLWADEDSRAEVQIGSAIIRLDANTGFSFLNLDDRTVQIQLTEGTINLRVRRLGRDEIFEVDTPNQAFSVMRAGQYRVQAGEDGTSSMVTVRQGEGEVTGGGQTYNVSSGQSGTFNGTDSLDAQVYAVDNPDDFDNWSQSRDRQYDGSRSARYVSRDVVGYEDLDNNGTWRSDPTYGNVWIPTSVQAGWAPYHDGHWVWISPWGWTWVDDAPWGYAPFHYGRWVSLQGNWGWVPGPINYQPVYAPALVAFIGGPGFGVSISLGGGGDVGWFPLGPREAYVPAYNTSPAYFNRVNTSNTNISNTTITNIYNNQVTNNTTNITNVTYANRTVPGAVTAVPQNAFRSSAPVARAAVAMNPKQIAAAPVVSRAAVVPTRESVIGRPAATANKVAQPSAAVANRPVVAKAKPPAPPVPFAQQQQELAKHPGQPLATHEVQSLRPPSVAAAHPLVKQAPPGKLTAPVMKPGPPPVANTGRPVNAPPAAPPANKPSTTNAGRPANAPPATPPANRPGATNAGRPANAPPATPPANRPDTRNAGRPANAPPATPPADRPGATNAGRPANAPPATPPADRPGTTNAGRPANAPPATPPADRPGTTNAGRPANAPPATPPANRPGTTNAGRPANAPPATPPANRPASAQPPTTPATRPANPPPSPPVANPEASRHVTAPPNRPVAAPQATQAPAPANRNAGVPASPTPRPVQADRPPTSQPKPPSKVQPGRPLTPAEAEKAREEQKKREATPPQN